ncbi:MAG TPA: RdgB/HAM1 family non-canonical purine NTP pyrophosphatase [Anaerolineales bacterium]
MNRPLLIATNNAGKVEELNELLTEAGVELLTPKQIGLQLEVEENGRNYAENAAKKALAFAQASGLHSLADDSGLEVDALGGAPGMYSARYSPKPGANDADRRAFLLENLLAEHAPRPWIARFHATIAIATPEGRVELAEGFCTGEIIPEERGSGGFGYDPIFLLPERGLTMAELEREEKNRLSHRGRAVRAALPVLMELLRGK